MAKSRRGLDVGAVAARARSLASLAKQDAGALAYLRDRGYCDARIAQLVSERRSSGGGHSPITHAIERAAIRVLAGLSTPLELWKLATAHVEQQRAAKDAKEGADAARRLRIAALAELHFESERAAGETITRDQVVARIQSGEAPRRDALLALADRPDDGKAKQRAAEAHTQASKEARALHEPALTLSARTISDWLREDCEEIPAPIGTPRKRKTP